MNLNSPLLKGINPALLKRHQQQQEQEAAAEFVDDGKPSLQFANFSGDITITWEEDQHELIKKLVEKKLEEGYNFFILKSRPSRIGKAFFGKKRVEVKSAAELDGAESLTVPTAAQNEFFKALNDPEVAEAVLNGTAKLTKGTKRGKKGELVHSKDPEEIARSKAVATRKVVGG